MTSVSDVNGSAEDIICHVFRGDECASAHNHFDHRCCGPDAEFVAGIFEEEFDVRTKPTGRDVADIIRCYEVRHGVGSPCVHSIGFSICSMMVVGVTAFE